MSVYAPDVLVVTLMLLPTAVTLTPETPVPALVATVPLMLKLPLVVRAAMVVHTDR